MTTLLKAQLRALLKIRTPMITLSTMGLAPVSALEVELATSFEVDQRKPLMRSELGTGFPFLCLHLPRAFPKTLPHHSLRLPRRKHLERLGTQRLVCHTRLDTDWQR